MCEWWWPVRWEIPCTAGCHPRVEGVGTGAGRIPLPIPLPSPRVGISGAQPLIPNCSPHEVGRWCARKYNSTRPIVLNHLRSLPQRANRRCCRGLRRRLLGLVLAGGSILLGGVVFVWALNSPITPVDGPRTYNLAYWAPGWNLRVQIKSPSDQGLAIDYHCAARLTTLV